MPMMASFQMGDDFFRSPFTVAAVMVVVSGLLVSRLPTYSFKKFKVPHAYMLPAMLTVGMVAAGMISAPWTTMSLIMLAYLGSLPFSYHTFRALKVEAEQLQARPGGEAPQAAGPPSNSAE
jgi:CDP-diacylglycerol--serine O-phosphatidyltransferase